MLSPWKKSYDKPRQYFRKQRHYFAHKGLYSQSYGFSCSHVWMWELDHKEGWAPKNWCFRTLVLNKILESPLESKEIKPVHPKGNQPWIVIGRTDAEVEAPILRPSDVKSWDRLKAGREGDHRRWDGWIASLTQWTWVWANSRRWWRTGRPGKLQPLGSQRVRHNLAAEQQQQQLPF